MSLEKGNRCNLHRRPDANSFLISLDRVEFDGIKLKVSLEKIDRPRYITPGNEAGDLSSSVLRNVIAWKLGILISVHSCDLVGSKEKLKTNIRHRYFVLFSLNK